MSDDIQRAVGRLEGQVTAQGKQLATVAEKLDAVLAHVTATNAVKDEQQTQHARRATMFGAIAGACAAGLIKLGSSLFGIHTP